MKKNYQLRVLMLVAACALFSYETRAQISSAKSDGTFRLVPTGTSPVNYNMIVNSEGKVGIGTPIPIGDNINYVLPNKLTVNGGMNVLSINTTTAIKKTGSTTETILTIQGPLGVIANGTDPASFTITDLHQTKKYSLFVEKGVVSEDFVIAQRADWADFVFGNEYKLPPLAEIENYVKENKHLPGIPSAGEISKDGYAVHEMNTLFLQKIEELTLYVIEQDKRIKELEAKLAEKK